MSDVDESKLSAEQIKTLIKSAALAKGDEGQLRKIIMLAAQMGWHAAGETARDGAPDGVFMPGGGMDAAMQRRAAPPVMAFDSRLRAGLPTRRARHV